MTENIKVFIFNYSIFVAVIIILTWALTQTYNKATKKHLHTKLKALIPIGLGIALYFFIDNDKIKLLHNSVLNNYQKLIYGAILGTISTSCYDIFLDRIIEVITSNVLKNKKVKK